MWFGRALKSFGDNFYFLSSHQLLLVYSTCYLNSKAIAGKNMGVGNKQKLEVASFISSC